MTVVNRVDKLPAADSPLEATLWLMIQSEGLPLPERHHRFHATRKWEFDFAWPEYKLAVEVEGGEWVGGRHFRPKGFREDSEKYNEAWFLGWKVLRFPGSHVKDGYAIETITKALAQLEGERYDGPDGVPGLESGEEA